MQVFNRETKLFIKKSMKEALKGTVFIKSMPFTVGDT